MAKQNFLSKKIKRHFLSINDSLENYFNKLRFFLINLKKTKYSTKYKAFGVMGIIIIISLTYLSLPNFYNQKTIQTEIKNQILKKYNIQVKLNENLRYALFPKPHFVAKNLSILRNEKEIAIVKNFKVFLDVENFFKLDSVEIKDLIFNKADFKIYQKDLKFFSDLLKTEPNENKIVIKDSNIFFKDKNEEVLFINKIYESKFFYDPNRLANILSAKNKIFNIPFTIDIKNDKFNKKIFVNFNSKKFRLDIENQINYENTFPNGVLDVLFINKSTSLIYELKKNSLNFESVNKNNLYNGSVDFKPFYFNANFNYEGLSSKNLFNKESILFDLIKSEIFNNPNLNVNLNFNVKNIININELNDLFFNVVIEEGEIRILNSMIQWKDDIDITINESLISYENDDVNLIGKVIFKIKDIEDFYSSYQIKKIHRKDIKEIEFDFVYNLIKKNINFDNVRIDNKSFENIDKLIDRFNSKGKRVLNKIIFKNLFNNFFEVYAG